MNDSLHDFVLLSEIRILRLHKTQPTLGPKANPVPNPNPKTIPKPNPNPKPTPNPNLKNRLKSLINKRSQMFVHQ